MNRDLTPEDEATFDAQANEEVVDDWLASWSDDFNSDEWAAVADTRPNTDLSDFAWLLLTLCVVIIGGAGILEWRMG
jgi:hypothetical protein